MRKYLLSILAIIMCLSLSLVCFATEEEYQDESNPFQILGLAVLTLLLFLQLT